MNDFVLRRSAGQQTDACEDWRDEKQTDRQEVRETDSRREITPSILSSQIAFM